MGQGAGSTGIELQGWSLDPETVGPQQQDPLAFGNFGKGAGLRGADAARHNQGGPAGDPACNFEGRSHVLRRQGDDGQIGPGLGQIRQGAGALDVEKAQGTGKFLALEGGHQGAGLVGHGFGRIGAARKYDDGLRCEEGGEIVLFHGLSRWV